MPPLLLLSPGRLSHRRPARPQSSLVCLPAFPVSRVSSLRPAERRLSLR